MTPVIWYTMKIVKSLYYSLCQSKDGTTGSGLFQGFVVTNLVFNT